MKLSYVIPLSAALCAATALPAQKVAPAAPMDSLTRAELHSMLQHAHEEVAKNYYDPKLRGVDMDSLYQKYNTRIDGVQTLNQGFAVIAGYLNNLHDSHTFFDPPQRTDQSEPGFEYRMIGDHCFITHTEPGSDAAGKLHVGDEIITYDGFKFERSTFDQMAYYFRVLATTPASALTLRAPDGTTRHEIVQHKVINNNRFINHGYDTGGIQLHDLRLQAEDWHEILKPRFLDTDDVVVWKQTSFDLDPEQVDDIFSHKIDKHAALVLDLRGNPGGAIKTLEAMLGHFFDHDVTIATLESRKPEKPDVAKPRGHTYRGKVFILVDSESASCAELFARVMQLEHRGRVIGDRTSGLVMEAKVYGESVGVEMGAGYAFSVTYANLHMTDGQSLEGRGVLPDEPLLPSASDLSAGHDPVLARAVEEAGGKFDEAAAAKAFPFIWPPFNPE